MIGHIKNSIMAALFVFGAIFLYQQIYYRYAPITWFLEYKSVTPVGAVYANKPIYFLSITYVKAGVMLVWADILKCKSPQDRKFKSYSSQPFEKYYDKTVSFQEAKDIWVYQAKVPSAGYVCYLEYGPLVKLPYGIVRSYPKEITETFIVE